MICDARMPEFEIAAAEMKRKAEDLALARALESEKRRRALEREAALGRRSGRPPAVAGNRHERRRAAKLARTSRT